MGRRGRQTKNSVLQKRDSETYDQNRTALRKIADCRDFTTIATRPFSTLRFHFTCAFSLQCSTERLNPALQFPFLPRFCSFHFPCNFKHFVDKLCSLFTTSSARWIFLSPCMLAEAKGSFPFRISLFITISATSQAIKSFRFFSFSFFFGSMLSPQGEEQKIACCRSLANSGSLARTCLWKGTNSTAAIMNPEKPMTKNRTALWKHRKLPRFQHHHHDTSSCSGFWTKT